MRKKNFRKWWRRLGFRQELRNLEKCKLAEQELQDTEQDVQAELDYMDVWNNSSHRCSFCEDCGDCHSCWYGNFNGKEIL
jgi:hypothetical protein